ncbi:MAG TPA: site-specific DNA-methyltransferase [Candidatus Syntrophosphaera sp.]|nr:site-specific DNA-methyltransferase [Candidatus Syntrophosphaera sp.]
MSAPSKLTPQSSQKPRQERIAGNTYLRGDCVVCCRDFIASGSIDLIITDPPYGIDGGNMHKHYNRDENYVLDSYIDVPPQRYQKFSRDWIREAARILRPGGQIYIVSGYTHLYEILHALHQTDLIEVNHLIWKYNFGVYTRRKFISSHYHILLYAKPPLVLTTFNLTSRYGLEERDEGNASLNYRDREDVWTINRQYKPRRMKNKNELPQELLIKMLQYSSNEGDLVCDLFLGGFTTARACIGLNRGFIGCELSEVAFAHQINQIRKLQPGFLFKEIRQPQQDTLTNRGRSWTQRQKQDVLREYQEHLSRGTTKKEALAALSAKYLRGTWALDRVIRSLSEKDSN